MRSSRRPPRPDHPFFRGAPLLVAHRGGAALAPENTLLAFQRALSWWGADGLELDVQPTRDGEVVVLHDSTVDRTTDGRGRVDRLRLAEVQRLDAGYRFSPDGGRTHPFRGRGLTIPTLAEVLEAFPKARVTVESKDPRVQTRVLELASAHPDRVLLAGMHTPLQRRFRLAANPRSASLEEVRVFWVLHRLGLARWARPAADAFQIPLRWHVVRLLTPRFLRDAHRHGVHVHAWTVNDPPTMRRLLAWGVDGLITDRPDLAALVLAQTQRRPLPPGPGADAEPFHEALLPPPWGRYSSSRGPGSA